MLFCIFDGCHLRGISKDKLLSIKSLFLLTAWAKMARLLCTSMSKSECTLASWSKELAIAIRAGSPSQIPEPDPGLCFANHKVVNNATADYPGPRVVLTSLLATGPWAQRLASYKPLDPEAC